MDVQNRHQVVEVGSISFVFWHAEESHENLNITVNAFKLTYIADGGTPPIVHDGFVKDLVYLLHLQILPYQLGTVSSGIYLGFAWGISSLPNKTVSFDFLTVFNGYLLAWLPRTHFIVL